MGFLYFILFAIMGMGILSAIFSAMDSKRSKGYSAILKDPKESKISGICAAQGRELGEITSYQNGNQRSAIPKYTEDYASWLIKNGALIVLPTMRDDSIGTLYQGVVAITNRSCHEGRNLGLPDYNIPLPMVAENEKCFLEKLGLCALFKSSPYSVTYTSSGSNMAKGALIGGMTAGTLGAVAGALAGSKHTTTTTKTYSSSHHHGWCIKLDSFEVHKFYLSKNIIERFGHPKDPSNHVCEGNYVTVHCSYSSTTDEAAESIDNIIWYLKKVIRTLALEAK